MHLISPFSTKVNFDFLLFLDISSPLKVINILKSIFQRLNLILFKTFKTG